MSKRKSKTVSLEEDTLSDWSKIRNESSSLSTPSPKTRIQSLKRGRPAKNSRLSASPHTPTIPLPGPFFEQEQSYPQTPPRIARRSSKGLSLDKEQSPLTLEQALSPDNEPSSMAMTRVKNQISKRHRHLTDEGSDPSSTRATTQPFQTPSLGNTQPSSALPQFVYPVPTVPAQPKDFHQLLTVPSSNNQKPALRREHAITYNGSTFTIPECTLVCALRMFVRHGNTGEHLDDDTATEVLKAYREGFGRHQNAQRSEVPDCQGLFDHVVSNHHRGGYIAEIWADLLGQVDHWNHIATRFWWDWIYYMDDLCRKYKLNHRLDELGTMINDEEILQRFNAVYENDQRIEFRPQRMPMPTLTAEQAHYKREMQIIMQRRVQTQQWQQQQAIQAQRALLLGIHRPMQMPLPVPSTPEPKQKPNQEARPTTPQISQTSEMAKQMIMPLPFSTMPTHGPPNYGLGYATL